MARQRAAALWGISIQLMTAMGQKQTLKRLHPMSALPPKADIVQDGRDVRFVLKADILHCGETGAIRSPRRREQLLSRVR
jgi:hypothetical protein